MWGIALGMPFWGPRGSAFAFRECGISLSGRMGVNMLPISPSRVGVLMKPAGSGERKDGGVCGARKRMVYRRDGAGV